MRKFRTILVMQLKEKLDLSFLLSRKKTFTKIVLSILSFLAVTAVAYLIFWLCQFLNIFSALHHIPVAVMSLVLTVILILNLCTCTVGLSKTLYYAKDNQVLVTYPVNPNLLFLSKMVVYYISELRKAFTFVIPIFFAYGVLSGMSLIYYLWMPLIFALITMVPVLIGGLLSIPMNYILRFLNRFQIIKIALFSVFFASIAIGVFMLINKIPANINLIRIWAHVSETIRNFLATFVKMFYPFYAITMCLCGSYYGMQIHFWTTYSYVVPLCLIGSIILLLGLNLLTARPLYLRLITKEFEFNKKEITRPHKNLTHRTFWSACVYETKRHLRDTSITAVTLGTLVMAPISILFLNKIYSAINTRMLGNYLTIAFNVLVILLLILAHNINVSSVFSRDGEALYLNKTKPNHPYQILLPRLLYNTLTSVIILTITSNIFFAYSSLTNQESFLCYVMMLSLTLTHIVWSAEIDFLNPQNRIYQTEGSAGNNPNENKSIILCFAFSGLAFVWTLFLLNEAHANVWLRLSLASVLFLILRVYLFATKTKNLFKEV